MKKKDFYIKDLESLQLAKNKKAINEKFYIEQLEKYIDVYGLEVREIIGHTRNSHMHDDFFMFNLEPEEYMFTTYKNKTFGRAAAIRKEDCLVIQHISFKYSTFLDCNFSNIVFENCSFVGCKFLKCTTSGRGVKFKDCSFSNIEFTNLTTSDNNFEIVSAIFEHCKAFMMELDNCVASDIVFNKSNFISTKIRNTNISYSIFLTCDFHSMTVEGSNFKGVRIIKPKSPNIDIRDSMLKTEFNEKTYLSLIETDRNDDQRIKKTVRLYKTFARQYKEVDLMDKYGEYFFLSKKTSLFREKKTFNKVTSFIGLISCGYGERPFYSLYISVVILFLSAFLYMAFGIRVGTIDGSHHIITGISNNFDIALQDFGTCLHFSIVTFTTVGYGNIVPIGNSIIVSSAEMILGVIMIAVWTSTLVRKMTR